MSIIEYVDRLPTDAGWFVLDVMPEKDARRRRWVALLVDVHPDELKNCQCKVAFLYVDPKDYKPGLRNARECYFRIPGKFKNCELAWNALQDMMQTRH
jgi:hypothetical protein